MSTTTVRDRLVSQQRSDVARAWTRRDAATGSLALLDGDLAPGDPLVDQLRGVGVLAEIHTDHLGALVRLGARPPEAVVVSAAIPAPDLARVVQVLRAELSVPVLLAFGPDEIGSIGPVVAAGALPVVSRPYRLPDLLAALQPHWPRRSDRGERVCVGDLTLDVDGYDARLGARRVDFTPGEFELLTLLARRADHVVLRDQLARRLWPSSPDPDAALVATVTRVRRKLAGSGALHAIHTVRGVGYRLDAAGLCAGVPAAPPPRE